MKKYKSSPFNNPKLDLIIQKIQAVNSDHAYIEKAKNEKIQYYTELRDKLENFPIEKIQDYDFSNELQGYANYLEKQDYWFKKVAHLIKGLERHAYAPEMNSLHFKNGKEIKVPQCTTIEQASANIIQRMSIEQLRAI